MEIVADISVFILACRLFYCGEIFALKAISAAEYVFLTDVFWRLFGGRGGILPRVHDFCFCVCRSVFSGKEEICRAPRTRRNELRD